MKMAKTKTSAAIAAVFAIGTLSAPTSASGADATRSDAVRTRRVSVSADGKQVGRTSEMPVINSNGRFVAFASRSPRLVADDVNQTMDVFVRDRRARTTELVSVSTTGVQGNGPSFPNAMSANGRYVVFTSIASTFAEGDVDPGLEEALDVFVHDRQTGVTERVSVASDGEAALGPSFDADISADGRYVVFESGAWNLSDIDGDQTFDVFVRDRQLGTTTLVSVNSAGEAADFSSSAPSISANGRFVAFDSGATNLDERDSNRAFDSFVHDRRTGTTRIVSISSSGKVGRFGGAEPEISGAGRLVLFLSESKLVTRDTNGVGDAYLHNLRTGRTSRVSRSSTGRQGNGVSEPRGISDDGRFVLFGSFASNLVPRDTNGDFDHFLVDRRTRETMRVNVNSRNKQAIGEKGLLFSSRLSGDGRFVVFESAATNLVPNDTNRAYDVFLRGPFVAPGA